MEKSTLVFLFGILSIVFSFTSLDFQLDERNKKRVSWLFFILIVIQCGFRDYVHSINDTANYYQWYNRLLGETLWDQIKAFDFFSDSYESRDLGYPILVKLTQLISEDFRFFLVVVAVIIGYPLSQLLCRYSTSLSGMFIGMALYEALFAGFFDTGIRQTIAMGLCYTAFLWHDGGKSWKWWSSLLLVSFTIHSTTAIFLPIFFLYKIENQKRLLLISILLAPIMMVVAKPLIATIGAGTIFEAYAVDSDNDLGTPVFTAMVVGVALSLKILSKQIQASYKDYSILMSAIVMALMLTPMTWVDSNFIRLVFYYLMFLLPLLSVLVNGLCREREDIKPLVYAGLASVLIVLSW